MQTLARLLGVSILLLCIIGRCKTELGLCQRICVRHRGPNASSCIKKHCASFIKNRLPKFGKRASTTIVGVKTEREGATIDINVKTEDLPRDANQTAWEGLIYLSLLHREAKRRPLAGKLNHVER